MKYQLTCPKCKHEFAYDNDHINGKLARNSAEITDINKQLSQFKLLPADERKRRKAWENRIKARLTELMAENSQLKSFRKVADQQVKYMQFQIFKNLVEEEFGTETYRRLLNRAEEELEAYKISGLMAHEYTRANYKTAVTNINKL